MKIVPDPSKRTPQAKKKRKLRRGGNSALRIRPDGPTPERMRQQGGIIAERHPVSPHSLETAERYRAACECRLDSYLRSGQIDKFEHTAGMQLRTAWLFKAHKIPTIDVILSERVDGVKPMTMEDRLKQLNWAERIIKEAFKEAKLTPAQSLAIQNVCCEDQPMGVGGHIKTLRRGLEVLARFWSFL